MVPKVIAGCERAGVTDPLKIIAVGHSLGAGASNAMVADGKAKAAWTWASPKMFMTYEDQGYACPIEMPGSYEFYNTYNPRFYVYPPAMSDVVASLTACAVSGITDKACTGAHCSERNFELLQTCDYGFCTDAKYTQLQQGQAMPPMKLPGSIQELATLVTYVHSTALYLEGVQQWLRQEGKPKLLKHGFGAGGDEEEKWSFTPM